MSTIRELTEAPQLGETFTKEGAEDVRWALLQLRKPGWNPYAHYEFLYQSRGQAVFGLTPWVCVRDVVMPEGFVGGGAQPHPAHVAKRHPLIMIMQVLNDPSDDWELWTPPAGETYEEIANRFGWKQ